MGAMELAPVREYFVNSSRIGALETTVRDLFLCLGRKYSPESGRMHVSLLMDLDIELLVEGFCRSGSCSLSSNYTNVFEFS